jgi:hypothetical protein
MSKLPEVKVVYIKEILTENNFTKNKIYDAQISSPFNDLILVKGNDGNLSFQFASHFITLAEWRNQQIDKILEE